MKGRKKVSRWSFDRRQLPIAIALALPGLGFTFASCSYLRPHLADQLTTCTVIGRTYSGEAADTHDVMQVRVKHVVDGQTFVGEEEVVFRAGNADDIARYSDGKQLPCKYLASSPSVISLGESSLFKPFAYFAVALAFFAFAAMSFRHDPKKKKLPF